jgi:predicted phosphodiesterase
MRLGLLADIHANREAYEACLARLEREGFDVLVILGDIVGYGPDPEFAAEKTAELAAQGAIVLRGNHDQALKEPQWVRNPAAREIIDWTRMRLSAPQIEWLAGLPLSAQIEDVLLVHASGRTPEVSPYIRTAVEAGESLAATSAQLTLCGHTHKSLLFASQPGGGAEEIALAADSPVSVAPPRRWLAVVGSAGLPRGGAKGACCATYDAGRRELAFHRVDYDVARTVAKMRAAGPCAAFADLLLKSA